MRYFLLILALVGCGKKEVKPQAKSEATPNSEPTKDIVDEGISFELKKPAGELTKADYEKVTVLFLSSSKLTDLPEGLEKLTQLKTLNLSGNQLTKAPKGLENLTQLTELNLKNNPALTTAQIAELRKAFPKCQILHNATK